MANVGDSNMNLADKSAPAPAATSGGADKEAQDPRKNFNYALYSDMLDEMRVECVDLCVTAVEKHPGNFEAGAKSIKEVMDKKFGAAWHVVIGEGYGFEITHDMRNLLYMFFGGSIGILLWKAS